MCIRRIQYLVGGSTSDSSRYIQYGGILLHVVVLGIQLHEDMKTAHENQVSKFKSYDDERRFLRDPRV